MKNTAAAKKAAQPPLEKEDEVSGKRSNVPAELQQRANALLNANKVDTVELKKIVHLLVSLCRSCVIPNLCIPHLNPRTILSTMPLASCMSLR